MSATEEAGASARPTPPGPAGGGSPEGLKRDATLAVATGFAVQATLVVTGALLARMLGPDGRGYLAALILWPLVITQLGNLGIPSALTYAIARDPSSSRATARLGLSFAIPQALLLTAFQALWLLLILDGDPAEVRTAGWLTLGLVPGMLAQQYGLGLLQGHLRLRLFNGLRLLPWLLYALGVGALFALGEDAIVPVIGVLLAGYWISGGSAVISGLRFSRGDSAAFRRPAVPRLLRAARPVVQHLGSRRASPDQVVLALFLSPADLGLYVVGPGVYEPALLHRQERRPDHLPLGRLGAGEGPTRAGRCGRSSG